LCCSCRCPASARTRSSPSSRSRSAARHRGHRLRSRSAAERTDPSTCSVVTHTTIEGLERVRLSSSPSRPAAWNASAERPGVARSLTS
jgi:hypothetical protein